MIINDPETLAEVTAQFHRYEAALVGATEQLHGADEILAFRKARPAQGLARRLSRTIITSFGHDFATASTLFHRDGDLGRLGRQMQTWARLPQGWRVVAAHVSVIPDPAAGTP